MTTTKSPKTKRSRSCAKQASTQKSHPFGNGLPGSDLKSAHSEPDKCEHALSSPLPGTLVCRSPAKLLRRARRKRSADCLRARTLLGVLFCGDGLQLSLQPAR